MISAKAAWTPPLSLSSRSVRSPGVSMTQPPWGRARSDRAGQHGTNLGQPRRSVGTQVGLGRHDDGIDRGQLHRSQVALEATQVEVVVQAHHQQCRVDVADDDLPHHLVAIIVLAARHLCRRLQPGVHPPLAEVVACGDHPVADGEHVGDGGELGHQRGACACAEMLLAVVQQQLTAVDFEHTHQVRCGDAARQIRQVAREELSGRRLQADALQCRQAAVVERGLDVVRTRCVQGARSGSCVLFAARRQGRHAAAEEG